MITTASTYTVTAGADKAGSRLDRLLAEALPEMSRTRLQALIAGGCVEETGARPVVEPAMRVRAGQTFVVRVPQSRSDVIEAQAIPLVVVYEDAELIVIDKPAGLVVHPGAGNPDGTLVNALLSRCGRLSSIGAPLRPGIVHRLDKDTSGLLVAAKTDAAHLDLARQFAEHSIERAYQALVWGNPQPPAGRISAAIGRSPHDRRKMAVVRRGGKAAMTSYETVRRFGSTASLLECRLATGRTHQIRVHMASAGHPIVGDRSYGRSRGKRQVNPYELMLAAFPRQALHAYLIGFRHPGRHQPLRFSSPTPNDFNELINCLEQM